MSYSPRIAGVVLIATVAGLAAPAAPADVITDWNSTAADIVVEAKMGPPAENRVVAMVQTAVLEAVEDIYRNAGTRDGKPGPTPGASVEAAVAAASRTVLARLV